MTRKRAPKEVGEREIGFVAPDPCQHGAAAAQDLKQALSARCHNDEVQALLHPAEQLLQRPEYPHSRLRVGQAARHGVSGVQMAAESGVAPRVAPVHQPLLQIGCDLGASIGPSPVEIAVCYLVHDSSPMSAVGECSGIGSLYLSTWLRCSNNSASSST